MNPVGDRATVFVVTKDNKAHLREIRRGLMVEGFTEVFGGLQEGDQVATVGQFGLRDNDLVNANHFAPWNKRSWKEADRDIALSSNHAATEPLKRK
jgi:hypothetical protein